MDFKTIKEKISNSINNIKSKFSKDNSSNINDTTKENPNETDGMMSLDDYYSQDTSNNSNSSNIKGMIDNNEKIKKGIEAAKSFISDVNYNPFADQEEVKKVDRKEFKDTWFMILIKIIITLIMIFLAVLCFIMIYKLCYDLLNDTDISSMGGYSDYLVREDNLSPLINENDLIFVKKLEYYEEGDIILYEFAGTSHKIGRIDDIVRGYYIIADNKITAGDYNSEIAMDLVVGKQVYKISNFKGIYDFITSPLAIILLVGIIGSYFYLMSKGKIKDKDAI